MFLLSLQWFSTGSHLVPRGHLAMWGDIFWLPQLGAIGTSWVEAGDAVILPSTHRIIQPQTATALESKSLALDKGFLFINKADTQISSEMN